MWKRKEEEPNPRTWVKANAMSNIQNYLIFEGIFLVLIFFMLIALFRGPYIGRNVHFGEDNTAYFEIPIWVVFIYMGSISIFMGFMLKIPNLIKRMDLRLRLITVAGLFFAGVNMLGITLLFLFWFGGMIIRDISSQEPFLLLITICVSIFYLIYDRLTFQQVHKRQLIR